MPELHVGTNDKLLVAGTCARFCLVVAPEQLLVEDEAIVEQPHVSEVQCRIGWIEIGGAGGDTGRAKIMSA